MLRFPARALAAEATRRSPASLHPLRSRPRVRLSPPRRALLRPRRRRGRRTVKTNAANRTGMALRPGARSESTIGQRAATRQGRATTSGADFSVSFTIDCGSANRQRGVRPRPEAGDGCSAADDGDIKLTGLVTGSNVSRLSLRPKAKPNPRGHPGLPQWVLVVRKRSDGSIEASRLRQGGDARSFFED
jgi:hypothetical protein